MELGLMYSLAVGMNMYVFRKVYKRSSVIS